MPDLFGGYGRGLPPASGRGQAGEVKFRCGAVVGSDVEEGFGGGW